ncbi:hypothetical protein [Rubellimicrobium sp. CFH 75288]|uniref:hypothetical protein n=1 Tax=Rubellimicrobium sp. CFH 75288 TaxID=2697034 RepID=UPI0014129AA1|nr:hypothetical protein [Rubellimicrobium sp. CFH 75288]NAZ37072.1 hypothetical protein [Rubellimicrobium sp. CFH 75288]
MTTRILAAALALAPFSAAAQSLPLDRVLPGLNPCAGLSAQQWGVPVGLDVLEEASLDALDLQLRGQEAAVSLSGRLACRTGADALVPGNAAAALQASAQMSLADCSVRGLDLRLGPFGGSYAPVLEAMAPELRRLLEAQALDAFGRACRDLRGY